MFYCDFPFVSEYNTYIQLKELLSTPVTKVELTNIKCESVKLSSTSKRNSVPRRQTPRQQPQRKLAEHRLAEKIECECGRTFVYQSQYAFHKKRECGRIFPCHLCNISRTTKSNLKAHLKFDHNIQI